MKCPFCGAQAYRRWGVHFDHEFMCSRQGCREVFDPEDIEDINQRKGVSEMAKAKSVASAEKAVEEAKKAQEAETAKLIIERRKLEKRLADINDELGEEDKGESLVFGTIPGPYFGNVCERCRFWELLSDEEHKERGLDKRPTVTGICRRYAPRPQVVPEGAWIDEPLTDAYEWCGEWMADCWPGQHNTENCVCCAKKPLGFIC